MTEEVLASIKVKDDITVVEDMQFNGPNFGHIIFPLRCKINLVQFKRRKIQIERYELKEELRGTSRGLSPPPAALVALYK